MDIKKILTDKLLEEYGDVKIALQHNFLAFEKSRDDKNVVAGFSYKYFEDAKTTIRQYIIPIRMWEDTEYFVTVKDYVTKDNIKGILIDKDERDYNTCDICYQINIDAFKYRAFIEDLSTPSEVKARKNPPFKYSQ